MSHFHDQSRGNYRNYYLRRRANHTDLAPDRDERLDLLTKNEHGDQLFKNKIVLDVGCNSGAVSTEIGKPYCYGSRMLWATDASHASSAAST